MLPPPLLRSTSPKIDVRIYARLATLTSIWEPVARKVLQAARSAGGVQPPRPPRTHCDKKDIYHPNVMIFPAARDFRQVHWAYQSYIHI